MRVEVRDLWKVYRSALRGRVEALRGVSLVVEEGELFVVLGPSGCGKSTLLNLIAGLDTPTLGEIHIGGKLVASPDRSLPPKERNVAMVFQNYALYPHMTAFDNIAFPLKVAGLKKEEINKKVREVAETLQIEHLLKAKPSELSGGERQRVAIARAIVRNPDLILLDEPLSNLDAQLRIRMKAEIRKIQRDLGITAIYVTHDQTEAMSIADRMAVMNEGKVVQVGDPMEVYRRPANTFVATFVGTPPMNLYRRRVVKGSVELFGNRIEVDTTEEYVYIGFRPEEAEVTEGNTLEVVWVERLGDEAVVHLRCGEEKALVKIHGAGGPEVGTKVGLLIKKHHIFEE